MAAVFGGTQSLHTNSFDEAIALPTDFSARIARNTQLILQDETHICNVVDPWAGSYLMESLTHDLADKAWSIIEEVEAMGGMTKAVESGWPKLRIEECVGREAGAHRPRRGRHRRRQQVPAGAGRRARDPRDRQHRGARGAARRASPRSAPSATPPRSTAALAALTAAAKGGTATCSSWRWRRRARARPSARSPTRWRRSSAATAPRTESVSGVYGAAFAGDAAWAELKAEVDAFAADEGRRPRILVAKLGQDGHDRGAKVIATGFADLGFDVDVGPLFQTPEEAARQAIENDVHVVGISTQAAGHKTLVPQLVAALRAQGAHDIVVVVGGVIPAQDYDFLEGGGRRRRLRPGHGHRQRRARSAGGGACRARPAGRLMPAVAAADPALVAGVLAGDRRSLAKAITLVERTRRDHQQRGQAAARGAAAAHRALVRVGISGVPGVGKTTFIEALGLLRHRPGPPRRGARGRPVVRVTGGSILGDKTRMEELSRRAAGVHPAVAGRPARWAASRARTREAMLVCEAAGYDVVVVETVGVGQSETAVASMIDLFVLLQLPVAGDELQGIKKGIVELADLLVINKADLAPERAAQARQTLKGALSILRPTSPHWQPPVLALSALDGKGIPDFWREVERFRTTMQAAGEFAARRRDQAGDWMWHLIDERLRADFRAHPGVHALLAATQAAVAAGRLTPAMAAEQLLARAREA